MKLEPANIICPKCGNGNYMRHLVGKGVGKLDMKCINCNSYFSFDELYKTKIAEAVKPRTNYDRIISKTPEELAKFMGELPCCPPGADVKELCYPMDSCEGTDLQVQCWLDWLKQEAE